MPTTTLRRVAIAALVASACALSISAGTAGAQINLPCVQGVNCPTPPASHACANADATPAADNLGKVERATLCLLNQQRSHHHLSRLRANRPLRTVARRYARLMVSKGFFDHVSPSGSTFVQRIQGSSYLSAARGWALGENLAWGSGPLATPREIVKAWMHSPGHRHNILDGHYRDAGLGVALGTPVGGAPGATYANEFGQRTA
jgi:uncharacterized protein YkwD